MNQWEFKLPDIGEGVTEGEVVAWFVTVGDEVQEDQPLVEVMTDKATMTITSPRAGKVVELRGKVGEVISVHSVLVVFEGDRTHREREVVASAVGEISGSLPGTQNSFNRSSLDTLKSAEKHSLASKPLATPAIRQLARTLHVELTRIPPTGTRGEITKADLLAYVQKGQNTIESLKESICSFPQQQSKYSPLPVARLGPSSPSEERAPLLGIQRKMAERMELAAHTAALSTFVEECNVTALIQLRKRFQAAVEVQNTKLSFLPFIVKAVVFSLKKHPILNAYLDEKAGEIVYKKEYHIGIATATKAGLVVPVVKNADQKNIVDIARDIERLARAARSGTLGFHELSGSTFTITSLGAKGGLFATPLPNFPEVGILGVHQIKRKPVVVQDEITIGAVMLLSLSFDHRLVDGQTAANFAYDVIGYLESPERFLLNI
ncbi:dihydrolipoamide acetyltransferase family protein [Pajaroellobacter abortibovis]|uniref:Dihydrolipoamide acetyltransferase component of pyruvate dehydrogenase complex n=1 Tax=Pajaroellobacter abortibovis TaxID=1882918 RepID=A0A1L6MZL4_9BACT|nr:dihydrolipoamide acetyltransferase family protein [Pajaroellobacter abortibovis]APS00847.1 hypothetical protein BCY86_02225 [Pajaroellobacter abortibovis]